MRLRVGVIYGGRSSEHEVSVASAASVIGNLDPNRYESVPIYINQEGHWTLPNQPPTTSSAAEIIQNSRSRTKSKNSTNHEVHLLTQPGDYSLLTIRREPSATNDSAQAIINMIGLDVIFPIVHGPYGEDGTIQGLFELNNVPYVGAGILASAIGMDKAVTKTLFHAHGLPIVDFAVVLASEWEASRDRTLDELTSRFDFPLFVKPANLGSSIGISKVKDIIQLENGIEMAFQFDFKIIVESSIEKARELECAVLGNDAPKASSVGEILPAGEFYDYASKYVDDSSTLVIPASLKTEQNDAIRTMALKAFHVIGCAGMARVDFLMSKTEKQLYINEINTIPGFTNISMYPRLWQDSGLEYQQLLGQLIDLALNRHVKKQSLHTKLFSSQPTDHL